MKMTYEYMAELHRFLHCSDAFDTDALIQKVDEHLKYIPGKKLYRYRKCSDCEFSVLKQNSIWLSDPQKFPDMFDATIPFKNRNHLYFDYPFLAAIEIANFALIDSAAEGEEIPPKEKLRVAVYDTIQKYSPEEIDEKCKKIIGEKEYEKMRERNLPRNIDFSPRIEILKEFFDELSVSPRKSLAITSFTTSYDNRNMWENYANCYTGFCVEYDFSKLQTDIIAKSAWDILHLLPIKYFATRPLFDYTDMLEQIIRADIGFSQLSFAGSNFLPQYYRSILAKQYDYRSEKEWRFIMSNDEAGVYEFPYIKKIILGKDASAANAEEILLIAAKLKVPVFIQTINNNGTSFKYKRHHSSCALYC